MQFIEVTIERNSTVMEDIRNFINYPISSRVRYYPTDKFTIISETGKKEELECPKVTYKYIPMNAYMGPKHNETPIVYLTTACKRTYGSDQFIGFNDYTTIIKRKTHNRYTKDNDTEFTREVFNDIPRYTCINSIPNIIPSIYNTAFLTLMPRKINNEFADYITDEYSPIIYVGCLEETYRMGHYCVAYDPTIVDETNLHYLIHWYFTQ